MERVPFSEWSAGAGGMEWAHLFTRGMAVREAARLSILRLVECIILHLPSISDYGIRFCLFDKHKSVFRPFISRC